MHTLRNIYRYAAGYIDNSAYSGEQLSADFEKQTGVKGISGSYVFPSKRCAQDFDHWASSFCLWRDGDGLAETKHLKQVWRELVKLNHELRIIQTNDEPPLLRDAIFGAASLFNPDDIEFYIGIQKRTSCSHVALLVHQDSAYNNLVKSIEDRTVQNMKWVASPKTLLSIYNQVKNRPAIRQTSDHFSHVDINHPEYSISPEKISKAIRYIGLSI